MAELWWVRKKEAERGEERKGDTQRERQKAAEHSKPLYFIQGRNAKQHRRVFPSWPLTRVRKENCKI